MKVPREFKSHLLRMIMLGIETSCDETALSIVDIQEGADGRKEIKILANKVLSQIELHKRYGGVFPMMAKREHSRNLIPLFKKTLKESEGVDSRFKIQDSRVLPKNHSHILQNVRMILEREQEMLPQFLEFIPNVDKPPIDAIAVTSGPGLEPALWVGINFAKALSVAWNIPVVPTNHMEGHVLISLLQRNQEISPALRDLAKRDNSTNYLISKPEFPALALLISGGHTELVLMKDWLKYEIVGRTRDDAVGEAFDKVARILGLPYPGGPEISALAEIARNNADQTRTNSEKITLTRLPRGSTSKSTERLNLSLPRPMLHSDNLDFSFSGLKTAVLYLVQKLTQTDEVSVREVSRPVSVSPRLQQEIAREFEDAVTEVIISKVKKAVETYGVQTLILGGGVVANKNIRTAFETLSKDLGVTLKLPAIDHATDNALMISIAGYFNRKSAVTEQNGLLEMRANGNLHF